MKQHFSTTANFTFSASQSGVTRQGFGSAVYEEWLKSKPSTGEETPRGGGDALEQEIKKMFSKKDLSDPAKVVWIQNKIQMIAAKVQEEEALKDVEKLEPLLDLDPIEPALTKVQLKAIRVARYWSNINGGKPFYCFRTVNNHQKYRNGDAIHERLGVSERTLRTHLKKICKKYNSYTAYMQAKDKFEGLPLLSYFDRVNRITYFLFNPDYEPQFAHNYFKKRASKNQKSNAKVTAGLGQIFAGRFAGRTYIQNKQNTLPLKCSFTDQDLNLDTQEEEDFFSCKNKNSFSSEKSDTEPNTGVASKGGGDLDQERDSTSEILYSKKAKERHRRDRQRQASHKDRKSSKGTPGALKQDLRVSEHVSTTVRHLQRIYEEVTGARQNPITDPEKIEAHYKVFVQDFQGDQQRFRCYAQSVASSDFLMGRNSSSMFIAWFSWAMKKENVQKVWSGMKYQLQKLYHDLVEAWSNSLEAIRERIRSLKAVAEEKNLRLRLLEQFGREAYVSWIDPLKIRLKGDSAVFKASNEFVKAKVEEKYGRALKQVCEGLGLTFEMKGVCDGV